MTIVIDSMTNYGLTIKERVSMEFKLPNYNLYIAYSAYVTLGEHVLCALR